MGPMLGLLIAVLGISSFMLLICVALLMAFALTVILGNVRKLQAQQRARRAQAFGTIAARRGLTYDNNALVGELQGLPVRVEHVMVKRGKSSVAYTRTTVRCPAPLPPGLTVHMEGPASVVAKVFGETDIQVGFGLDPHVFVRGSAEPDIQDLFVHPGAQSLAKAIAQGGGRHGLRDNQLCFQVPGHLMEDAEGPMDTAVELAKGLFDARMAPWHALVPLDFDMQLDGDCAHASGVVRGHRVTLTGYLAKGFTTITVPLPPGLPTDLSVTYGPPDEGVNDPILDRMVTITGGTLQRRRHLFVHDDARSDLLAVVHAHPRSNLSDERVQMVVQSASDPALMERITDAVRLAHTLSTRVQAVEQASNAATRQAGRRSTEQPQ